MDTVVDFVLEHYLWFIIGITIIVMVIIGYIVDKHNFGIKDEPAGEQPPKKEKKKKEKKEGKAIKIENKGLNDLTQPVENVEAPVAETEDLYSPLPTDVNLELNQEQFDDSLFTPLTGEVASEVSEVPIETPVVVDAAFNEETNQLEAQPVVAEPVIVPETENIVPVEIQTPLENGTEQTTETKSDDEVWKF